METTSTPPQLQGNLGKLVLDPLNHAIAAGEREALKVGVPTHDVVEMLLNHLASVVAMIEPAGVRVSTIEGIIESFARLVRQHVDARLTSPGGIVHPNAGVPS